MSYTRTKPTDVREIDAQRIEAHERHEPTCDGCAHENDPSCDICGVCSRFYADMYERSVVA